MNSTYVRGVLCYYGTRNHLRYPGLLTRSDVDDGALDDAHRVARPALVRRGVHGRGVGARRERQEPQRPVVRGDREDVARGRHHAGRVAEAVPRDRHLQFRYGSNFGTQ